MAVGFFFADLFQTIIGNHLFYAELCFHLSGKNVLDLLVFFDGLKYLHGSEREQLTKFETGKRSFSERNGKTIFLMDPQPYFRLVDAIIDIVSADTWHWDSKFVIWTLHQEF